MQHLHTFSAEIYVFFCSFWIFFVILQSYRARVRICVNNNRYMNIENRIIAIVGLGYVGLPLAIEFGKKYRVIGFDVNAARVAELQRGEDHTLEADLAGMQQARTH